MKIKYLIVLTVIFGVFFTACDDDFSVKHEAYAINSDNIPSLINYQTSMPVIISVNVQPYTYSDLNNVSVGLEIFLNNSVIFSQTMVDDGLTDESGDKIKFDGEFSTMFPVSQFPDVGNYSIKITGEISGKTLAVTKDIIVLNNEKPEIVSAEFPDSLLEKVQTFVFDFTDGNGINDLQKLELQIFQDADFQVLYKSIEYQLNNLISENYELEVIPSFGAGMIGNKWFRIILHDIFVADTLDVENPVYIVNSAPELVYVQMQDSVKIPSDSEINYVQVSAKIMDERGLKDIVGIFYSANNSNPAPLFDDGDFQVRGDEIAGDGIYSQIFSIDSTNNPSINTFIFYAQDKMGQVSSPDTLYITAY